MTSATLLPEPIYHEVDALRGRGALHLRMAVYLNSEVVSASTRGHCHQMAC